MKKLFALLTAILLTICCCSASADDKKTIAVTDFNSFLQAVRPNVIIVLTNDIEIKFDAEEIETVRNSQYLEINSSNALQDKGEILTVKNLQNLEIIGNENSENKNAISSGSSLATTIKFSNVQNIFLQKVRLVRASLELNEATNFVFENSEISECKINLVTIINSENINFISSSFSASLYESGSYGFNINNSKVTFKNSLFTELSAPNLNSMLFLLEDRSSKVDVKNSKFLDNNTLYFSNDSLQIGDQINLFNNEYHDNNFATPSIKHSFSASSEKKYEKFFIHKTSGVKLYQSIPVTSSELGAGKIIPFSNEIKFIKQEGEETKIDDIVGHWIYVDYNGNKGYVFDGLVSALPTYSSKAAPNLKLYYQDFQQAGIDATLESKIIGYTEDATEKYNFDLVAHSLQFNSCNDKDLLWAFSSLNHLAQIPFPNPDLIKSLIKNKKPHQDAKSNYSFDGEEITLTSGQKNQKNLVINLNQSGEIILLENSATNHFDSNEITFTKQGKCLWKAVSELSTNE